MTLLKRRVLKMKKCQRKMLRQLVLWRRASWRMLKWLSSNNKLNTSKVMRKAQANGAAAVVLQRLKMAKVPPHHHPRVEVKVILTSFHLLFRRVQK